ncbi:MAG: NADH-quinone oxidoreductase subunit N [Nitrospira sp.]|nr:NADH-quinone oxidoreductase subunit N [Nitrospira sp.]
MTTTDLFALSPILAMGSLCIMTMLGIAVRRHHATIATLAAASVVITLGTLPLAASVAPRTVAMLLRLDTYALLYMGLVLAATLIVIALSYHYWTLRVNDREECEEFYLLVLVATFGALILTASVHFVSFFLGLELISVSLYGLIGYLRTRRAPLEASLKYLLLSSTASAFLLFGMALLYFQTGTMVFAEVGAAMAAHGTKPLLWLGGLTLVMVAIGFKLGLAPFHLWIPDVYQGAPTPITAYVATVAKVAVVALLLRFVSDLRMAEMQILDPFFGFLAAASMLAGNFLALLQQNVKRLLACSSIAHFGYLQVALLAGGPFAAEAVTFYLVAYVTTTLGAFGVVTVRSTPLRDADTFEDYRGLFWSRPWLAVTFILSLLSLAGIPITAGFLGKFYAIAAGVQAGLWPLVLLLILNSAIGVYYYLRLIVTLFDRSTAEITIETSASGHVIPGHWATVLSLSVIASMLLWLGSYPGPAIDFIRLVVTDLATTALHARF